MESFEWGHYLIYILKNSLAKRDFQPDSMRRSVDSKAKLVTYLKNSKQPFKVSGNFLNDIEHLKSNYSRKFTKRIWYWTKTCFYNSTPYQCSQEMTHSLPGSQLEGCLPGRSWRVSHPAYRQPFADYVWLSGRGSLFLPSLYS